MLCICSSAALFAPSHPTHAAGPKGLHRRISVHTWTERGYAPPRNNPFNNGSLKMCEQENGETLFSPLIEKTKMNHGCVHCPH
jgi:hypothetical protein